MELFKLFGSILIDNKDAIDKLNKTDKKASGIGATLNKMGSFAAKAGTAILTLGTGAATAMTKLATNTASSAKEIDKFSKVTGFTTEAFQEWDYIMKQNGYSMEQASGDMAALAEKAMDAAAGAGEGAELFGKLGVQVTDSSGKLKSQEQLFEETITALQGMNNETERNAIASALMSTTGEELTPILSKNSDEIERMKQEAHDMGGVMSETAVSSGVALSNTISQFQTMGASLMNSLGSTLMPVFQTVLDLILENMPMIQSLFQQLAPILADVFSKLLPPLLDLATALLPPILDIITMLMPILGDLLKSIIPVLITLLETLLPPIIEIVEKLLPVLLPLIESLMPLLEPILSLLTPLLDAILLVLDPLIDLINMILPPLIAILTTVINTVIPPLSAAFAAVGGIISNVFAVAVSALAPVMTGLMAYFRTASDVITNVLGNAFKGISGYVDGAKKAFKGIVEFLKGVFTGDWKRAFDGLRNVVSGWGEAIGSIFKFPINTLIDLINKFIGGLNKLKIPDWVPNVGGKGINLPKIPKLKVGMDYVPSDDFPALLHKGEAVLTAEENAAYQSGKGGATYNIYLNNMPASDAEKRKLAQYIEEERRRGLMSRGVFA